MRALVSAGAPVTQSPLVEEALRKADLLIAANGGGARLLQLGVTPNLLVGDLDSLTPGTRDALVAGGTEFIEYPPAKDKTDTHLALEVAFERGATQVDMLGLFGGDRLDHAVANSLLLAHADFRERDIRIIDGANEARLCRGWTVVQGKAGDYLTLIPLTPEVTGIRTKGLRYEVPEGRLMFGDSLGVSNELIGFEAAVSAAQGTLLVLHHHRS
ncbi:MAG: thiamine diphosphokinase [Dehalococcoidia bacterium]